MTLFGVLNRSFGFSNMVARIEEGMFKIPEEAVTEMTGEDGDDQPLGFSDGITFLHSIPLFT
jgi:hypothetical protein